MARLLIGWELGGGLGHAGRLEPLAAGLVARGHAVTMWLADLVQTRRLLADLPVPQLQAPIWTHRTVGVPSPQVSLAEILLGCGYLQADHLEALVQAWLSALRVTGAEAMLVDYAPTALLAARIAGVPAASIGMGFWLPPAQQPIPAFRDWEPLAPGRVAHAERQVLANVNTVLARHGAAPLAALWQLFRGDLPLLCSWPEIDHYARAPDEPVQWLGPNFLPDAGQAPHWPAGEGLRVFAYLKAGHPDHAAVLAALAGHGCRVLCYLPEVNAGLKPPVVSDRIRYATGPVDLTQAFAEARLAVCHAGQATVVQALLAGVPLLLLPMQAEQFLMSRQVERTGAAINAAMRPRPTDFGALVDALLTDPAPRQAAQTFARRHAGFDHATQVSDLLDRIEAMLPARAA
ncbi:MAG: hypothetical protein JNL87_01820 [Burkholderiaceae bacterium]|nr:hypothetical protein [Burkholderiaceae bacterium]